MRKREGEREAAGVSGDRKKENTIKALEPNMPS